MLLGHVAVLLLLQRSDVDLPAVRLTHDLLIVLSAVSTYRRSEMLRLVASTVATMQNHFGIASVWSKNELPRRVFVHVRTAGLTPGIYGRWSTANARTRTIVQ